jgi:uncharacterized repeat protein (TIGR03803 family)
MLTRPCARGRLHAKSQMIRATERKLPILRTLYFLVLAAMCLLSSVMAQDAVRIEDTVYRYEILYNFCSKMNGGTCLDGQAPYAGLIEDAAGNLYGTTQFGGTGVASQGTGGGIVFKVKADNPGQETVLYSFCSASNCSDGAEPYASLIQDTAGNLYGTTAGGGGGYSNCPLNDYVYGSTCGTVFKLDKSGNYTVLYSFCSASNCPDGGNPLAGLLQSAVGDIYGTTFYGGTGGEGTVFKLDSTGHETVLYSFCPTIGCSDGDRPYAGLIQDAAGNLYGTTTDGGANNYVGGTVFKIDNGGSHTVLYSFCSGVPINTNCPDGSIPSGNLIQDAHGNLYGTTQGGGANGRGTVFKVDNTGQETVLYSFCSAPNCTDGAWPYGGVIQDAEGNLYGTTFQGGANNVANGGGGTVFRLAPPAQAGDPWTETVVHSFCSTVSPYGFCSDGLYTYAGLLQDAAGHLYGTTLSGGVNNGGVVFKLTVAPVVTLSPTWLSFGNVVIDTTSTAKTVTLTNSGTATLNISSITVSGGFAIFANTCGATLAPGKKCKVSITFTPTQLGKLSGTLTFVDNAPNSQQAVALSGKGVLPATLTPATVTYGAQTVGTTSPPKTFNLTNNQTITLNNILITATGDFAVAATNCANSLAAKSKCWISVTFTPAQTGTRTGQLSVSDSANNSPQTSSLKGTGK